MKKINVNELKPGMKVAVAICNENLIPIVKSGFEITEQTISNLTKLGVKKIFVESFEITNKIKAEKVSKTLDNDVIQTLTFMGKLFELDQQDLDDLYNSYMLNDFRKSMFPALFEQMTKIAVDYCNLKNGKLDTKSYNANEILEYFNCNSIRYNSIILEYFLKKVELYKVGQKVELSNGQKGFVIRNTEVSTRPVVSIYGGNLFGKNNEINLLNVLNVTIVA